MEGPDYLRVLIGPARIPGGADQPTLVLDAQPDRLEALRQQLGSMPACETVDLRHAVLASSSGVEVIWFRFNDTRLNGVVPLERWQPHYPNLQLIGQDTLAAQTLEDILNTWSAAENDQIGIDLTLAQGDPLQVLAGAGCWLHRLQKIRLQGPRIRELWWDCCDSWLQQQGFRTDPQDPLGWILDPLSVRLNQQQRQIQEMRDTHEQEINQQNLRLETLLAALHHVFPYTNYRLLRPDLSSFTNEELVEHFAAYGIDEGVNLQFSGVEDELQQLRAHQAEQTARLEILNEKTRHTSQQLDLLKDLFARLMVNP
jgi:hypothetical protein